MVRLNIGTCLLLCGAETTVAAAADLQSPEGAQGGDQDDRGEGRLGNHQNKPLGRRFQERLLGVRFLSSPYILKSTKIISSHVHSL